MHRDRNPLARQTQRAIARRQSPFALAGAQLDAIGARPFGRQRTVDAKATNFQFYHCHPQITANIRRQLFISSFLT
jgi:hypothetical protein